MFPILKILWDDAHFQMDEVMNSFRSGVRKCFFAHPKLEEQVQNCLTQLQFYKNKQGDF